ncbi:hypothetical protein ECHHL_0392 [Ehrlichia chaffeensis str. Heartland]|uniref:Uncharacterized protein n=1 Tax=Ehrlichia chaffeensis (strain ATCC CRL-10679 / Arkansas) TaxID=205920 RepID=Q2GH08_EHRCR|nr:hypothetical protein ECH_0457 [Ehrlichia chaffeensis str. Arkansas]AHX03555.1 hypothetical protein ECHHL_0392 [Ehrlichia chaffeensis str. Heartland]AHX05724.1 hypothetical protein ECHJAX_0665 [Ehrlichia chaffeensis str. Jax]AHX06716.1 hypothetical protein ECHLIB_0669 [Ehrlichia chaffeensis str. Liberty]AHX07086.1 hypothetical protein ECHOSC_0400 [Ehrlichia chaffeensis str. Osceola]AHX08970.1 hypothetical protein ECHSTV_0654 [Ehrlichia chaffeensis str. Saint Vincent]AHX09080.1 hypothetical 
MNISIVKHYSQQFTYYVNIHTKICSLYKISIKRNDKIAKKLNKR